jgi:hypothetical protein
MKEENNMKMSWSRVFLYAAVLALFCQLNAAAQEPPKIITNTVDRNARAATMAYWTPERMQAATPMDLLERDSSNVPAEAYLPTDAGSSGFSPGQAPAASPARFAARLGALPGPATSAEPTGFLQTFYNYPEPFSRADVPSYSYDESTLLYPSYPQSTIGKLFFTIGTQNFVCSASVIRPHLLLTARHCVYDGVNTFSNWVFYPGYHSGANVQLGGAWFGRYWTVWSCPCNLDGRDIAFIQTYDDDTIGCNGSAGGFPIENYTGYLGYSYAGNSGNEPVFHYTEVGYPQAPPFSGNRMVRSDSSTADFDLFGNPDTVEVGSDLTGGASGGPWIWAWDEGSSPSPYPSSNIVNGLNSFKWTNPARPLEMGGPQFKEYNFNQLLTYAVGLSCP